jgi:uncharacterized protein YkwD
MTDRRLVLALAALCAVCVCTGAAPKGRGVESTIAGRPATPRSAPGSPPADAAAAEAESFDARRLADLVFDLSNAERVRAGLRPLARSRPLDQVAGGHSTDMARRNYFSHTSRGLLKRAGLSERLKAGGVAYRAAAENIALYPLVLNRTYEVSAAGKREVGRQGTTYGDLARSVVKGWMDSRGHRENLLNPTLELMGIGVALGTRDGTPYAYVTQNMTAER